MKKRISVFLAAALLAGALCMAGAAAAEPEEAQWYTDGVYRVGGGIPAGQYYIVSTDSAEAAYYTVSGDAAGSLDSIVAGGSTGTFAFVTVREGEYLELRRAKAALAEQVPPLTQRGPGMYRVGTDLPAGQYRLESTTRKNGYAAVFADDRRTAGQAVSEDSFRTYTYVTVAEGQYLELTRCRITQENPGAEPTLDPNWQWDTQGGVDRSRNPVA